MKPNKEHIDKAKELVEQFKMTGCGDIHSKQRVLSQAKQCALICVEEILNENQEL